MCYACFCRDVFVGDVSRLKEVELTFRANVENVDVGSCSFSQFNSSGR